MKKLFFTLSLALMTALTASAQLMYKVSGDSLAKPSYIVATHKLLNPLGTVEFIPGVNEALNEADQFYFEVDPAAVANQKKDKRNLSDGRELKSLLTAAQLQQLDAFLKKYTEVGWAAPYSQKRYAHITPCALLDDLEQLLFVANHMGEYDPTHSFDSWFEAQARRNGLPVRGLDNAEQYFAATYGAPLDAQTARLVAFLADSQGALLRQNQTTDAFSSRDLDAFAKAAAPADAARMGRWAAAMPAIMQQASTLFVLDAGFLCGQQGILQQLREAGFTVEGMQ